MIADVDVGVLLSGGIDSSLIAHYAARSSKSTVKAFTVTFSDGALDESRYAESVARSMGMDLVTMPGSKVTADLVSDVAFHAGEPLGDPACVPTFMISKVLSGHVKAVLSGEGADELFWGYPHYRREKAWLGMPWRPRWGRISWILGLAGQFESSARVPAALSRMAKVATTPDGFGSLRWVTVFGNNALSKLLGESARWENARFVHDFDEIRAGFHATLDPLASAVGLDISHWLPDDLLTKVDRMTMAHSVEARTPFLDHSVVEMALSIPSSQKISGRTTKAILRQLLGAKTSGTSLQHLHSRSKHGFEVPVRQWLSGELRDATQDMLGELCGSNGIELNQTYVEHLWHSFLAHRGSKPFSRKIWLLLSFALWHHHHQNRFGIRSGK
jgi:asparagine synthase (glutamine-hydrolysing)